MAAEEKKSPEISSSPIDGPLMGITVFSDDLRWAIGVQQTLGFKLII